MQGKKIREKNERPGQGQVIPLFTRERGRVYVKNALFFPREWEIARLQKFLFFFVISHARVSVSGGEEILAMKLISTRCTENIRIPHISLRLMLYPAKSPVVATANKNWQLPSHPPKR